MKLFYTTSLFALVSLTAPVQALDIGGGFSLTGNLEYEWLDIGSGSESFGLLDADLVYENASGFGGFIGVNAISSGFSEEVIYGALTYSGSFGKLQIGAPRSALNDYVNAPAIGTSDFLDLQLSMFAGSILPVALLNSNKTALGLRYDGSFGATSVGISYHRVEGTTIVDAAMNHSFGQTKVMAGLEHISEGSSSGSSYFLGAEHDFGQLVAGAILGRTDFFGSDVNSVQAYAVYSVSDRLDLSANVLSIDSAGPNGTLYGLGANFDLTDSVYVEAGYIVNNDSFGSEDIASISIGVNF